MDSDYFATEEMKRKEKVKVFSFSGIFYYKLKILLIFDTLSFPT